MPDQTNPFDQFDQPSTNAFDQFDAPAAKPAGVGRKAADLGLSVAKGVVAVPEAAVGVADLVTGGAAGKAVESLGVRFKDAKDALTELQSDDLKGKQREFQEADGILPKVGVALTNPSLIANTVAESLPSMFAGGVLGRGVRALAPGVSKALAAGAGEGIVGAGSAAEQIRQDSPTGDLTGTQALLAAGSGATTAALGAAGGALARRAGWGDPDVMLTTGSRELPQLGARAAKPKGVVRRVAEGAAGEMLEEVPQSVSEQGFQNVATDRPLTEGMVDAGVMGGLAGGVMGGVAGGIARPAAPAPTPAPAGPLTAAAALLPAPGAGSGTTVYGQGTAVADAEGRVKMPGVPSGGFDDGRQQGVHEKPTPVAGLLPPPADVTVDAQGNARAFGQVPQSKAPSGEVRETGAVGRGRNSEDTGRPRLPAGGTIEVDREGRAATGPQRGGAEIAGREASAAEAERRRTLGLPQQAREGDLLAEDGKPYRNGVAAARAAKAAGPGYRPVRVNDREFVVRRDTSDVIDVQARTVDDGAHQAAASPRNDHPEPSKGQILAGNAKLGHAKVGGLGLSIENPAGSVREDKQNTPPKWRTPMEYGYHYGYFKRTQAADSSEAKRQGVDAFVKEGIPEDYDGPVFVVDQVDPKTGAFDEHKVVIGPQNEVEASNVYRKHYQPGWKGLGAVTRMSMADFRAWVRDGKKALPAVLDPQAREEVSDASTSPPAPAPAGAAAPAASGQPDAAAAGGSRGAVPGAQPAQTPVPAAAAPASAAPAVAKGLRVGVTPGDAEPVTVRDGVVYIGKHPALDFDSGEEVRVPAGANDLQIKKALADAGVLSTKQKFFGASATSAVATPGAAEQNAPKGTAAPAAPTSATAETAATNTTRPEAGDQGTGGTPPRAAPAAKPPEEAPPTGDDVGVAIEAARILRRDHPSSTDPRTDRILVAENYLQDLARKEPERAASIAKSWRADPGRFSEATGLSPDRIGALAKVIEDQLKVTNPPAPAADSSQTRTAPSGAPAAESGETAGAAASRLDSSTGNSRREEEFPEGEVTIPADPQAFSEAMRAAIRQADSEDERAKATFRPEIKPVSLPRVTASNPTPKGIEFLSPEAAAARLEAWKAEADRQGRENASANAGRTVISLFDASGVLAQPWVDAGYNVVAYDLQTGDDINEFDATTLLETHGNDEIWAILAQPPCTDFASSGAQWWKAKDADGRTEASNELVRQTLRTIELFRPPVWVMENPVGRIATQNNLPKPLLQFDPWHFGDNYTKRTELYGNFNNELPLAPVEPTQGSKIHRLSSSAKYERSLTPEGFAYALFMANNAESFGTAERMAREFAGVDVGLFRAALEAGHPEFDVRNAIVDAYYDNDLEFVREELQRLVDARDSSKPRKANGLELLPQADGTLLVKGPADEIMGRLAKADVRGAKPGKDGVVIAASDVEVARGPLLETLQFMQDPAIRYTVKEAEREWDKSSKGMRASALGRIGLREASFANTPWAELTPSERRAVHRAVDYEHNYTPEGKAALGQKPPEAPKVDQAVADFNEGKALWDAASLMVKRTALNKVAPGSSDQGQYAKWDDLAPFLRTRVLPELRAAAAPAEKPAKAKKAGKKAAAAPVADASKQDSSTGNNRREDRLMTLQEAKDFLTGGGHVLHHAGTEFEEEYWIEETKVGQRGQTWVVKQREKGSRATFTTGPGGADAQWGWSKGDAAERALERLTFKGEGLADQAPGPVGAPAAPEQAPTADKSADARDKVLSALHFLINNRADKTGKYTAPNPLRFNELVREAKQAGIEVSTQPPGASGTVVWTFAKPDGWSYSAYLASNGKGTWIAHSPGTDAHDKGMQKLAADWAAQDREAGKAKKPAATDSSHAARKLAIEAEGLMVYAEKQGNFYVRLPDYEYASAKIVREGVGQFRVEGRGIGQTGLMELDDAIAEAKKRLFSQRDEFDGAAAAPPAPIKTKPAASGNTVFTDDMAEKARARLKAKLGRLNSGLDPEMMLDGITLAGWHLEKGARTFAAFARAMVDDLGAGVKPYLKSWYSALRYDPRAQPFVGGMSSAAMVDEFDLNDVAAPSDSAAVEPQAPSADTLAEATDDSTPSPEPATDDRDLAAVPSWPAASDNAAHRGAIAPGAEPGGADDGSVRQPLERAAEPDDGAPGLGQRGSDERVPDGRAGNLERDRERVLAGDHRAPAGSLTREGSWFATAKRNVDLIELALKIEAEKRAATPEEQAQLAKYVGFGASEIRNALFPVPGQYARQQEPDRLIWPNLVYEARWKPLAERLEKLPREWQRSVLQSTQYAHYTSEGIVRGIWGAVQRMGFTGGKTLEPGTGIGNFVMAMPESMRRPKGYTGIEMDGPTALIARLLSPAQNMLHEDFIKRKLPRDFFDLAIGNPPFSQTKILGDPDYEKHGFMLHDFFFAKSIDRVRPGGLLVFVTSKGTMDKQTDRARKYLAERADLLGAIRLPSTAFEANAGTSVVTDVIFLRKREEGAESAGKPWTGVATVETPDGPVVINEYFAANPDMVLGQNRISGNQDDEGRRINSNGRGGEKYTVVSYDKTPADLDAKFAAAVQRLPENVYSPLKANATRVKEETRRVDYDPKVKREGVVYLDGKNLMRVENGLGRELTLSAKEAEWMRSYVGLRDLVQTARQVQADDGAWEPALKALNKAYDAFVKKHGPINDYRTLTRKSTDEDGNPVETTIRVFKNKRLLREDYDHALMISLEQIDEAGKIKKSPFLLGRTIGKPQPREVKTVGDALAVSLDETGRLDLADVARRLHISEQDAIEALGSSIYKTPAGQWQLADEYLSGDVVAKLEEAQTAAAVDPSLERNIEALKAVQPERLGPSQISVKLGASWVPAEYVSEFAQEIGAGAVTFDSKTESWQVQGGNERSARRAGAEYGTAARSPSELLEAALNSRQVTIKTKNAEKKEVTDAEATTAANEMLRKIKDKFKSWVWTDTERAATLVDTYNRRFNNIAPRRFDGSHLTLPGVSLRFKLHPHQLRAIWRQIQTGNTYLAHAVGAGKTIEMIAGGMEQRRLGLIKKPMYVVPNHMLEQFSNEFMELYPLANIMVADDENFSAERRKAFVAAATLNAPDAIIITHDAFQRVGVREESVAPIRDEILTDLEMELDGVGKADRVRRSQLEQQIEAVTQRFDSIIGMGKKDNVVPFEDMGVDFVYVDEAHAYRKLDFTTNQQIKGIDPSGSRRALDMYVKTRVLERRRPGRAFAFASGTAVTNTMGELYTLMRFFIPEEMARAGITSFDSWARQFGEVGVALEANAAGRYENVTRFSKFDNVPELMSRVRQFMDVLTSDHLGSLVKRPDLEGGKPNLVLVEATKALKNYMKQELSPRLEASRAWKPSFEQPHNPDPVLAIISDGRFAALDPRFFGGTVAEGEESKLDAMAKRIVDSYHATADNVYVDRESGKEDPIKGSAQIVFYNLGFGEGSMANRGFNARTHLTKKLVDGGVKRDHILWFDDANTDAKKEAMFQAMRNGKARILIGSAKKMGTGVNVQKRLARLHYFDPPWYPSDVEQPHGRIIRQGNQNERVGIDWYATKGAYDSTMWQMVGRKQRFIDQAFSGDKTLRSMEDMSEASQYEQAAAMASGDPRALQLAGYRQDVERLERLQAAHANEQIAARDSLRSTRWSIDVNEKRIAELETAMEVLGGNFFTFSSGTVAGRSYDKVGEFGQAVKDAFNKVAKKAEADEKRSEEPALIGKLGPVRVLGYPFWDSRKKDSDFGGVELVAAVGEEKITVASGQSMGDAVDAVGLGRKIVNAINGVSRDLDERRRRLVQDEADEKRLNKKLGVPFEHQQDLLEKYNALKQLEEELRAEGEAEAKAQAAAKSAAKEIVIDETGGEDPASGERPVFARRPAAEPAFDAERRSLIQAAVDQVTASWKRKIPVHVLGSMDEAPADVRAEMRRQGAGEAQGETAGFLYDGEIYLVANQLANRDEIREVLFHEALGHYGLRGAFGDGLVPILQQLATMRPQLIAKKAREYGLDLANQEDRLLAAEEVLAEMAQTKPELGWVQRTIALIRRALRALGAVKGLTDNDIIANYILPARGFVERGRGAVRQDSRGGAPQAKVTPLQSRIAEHRLAAMGYRMERGYEDEGAWIEHQDGTQYDWNDQAGRFEDEEGNPLPKEAAEIAQYIGNVEDGLEDPEAAGGAANDRSSNPFRPMFSRGHAREVQVDGKWRPITDSRGGLIAGHNLEAQRAFWRWFGDSKVVDAKGRPLVVYHGTNRDVDSFDNGKTQTADDTPRAGFYFTEDARYADLFASKSGGNLMPVYLSVKNPLDLREGISANLYRAIKGAGYERAQELLTKSPEDYWELLDGDRSLIGALESLGYDGLRIKEPEAFKIYPEAWVAFHPEQIKSAIGNRGTFDPKSPDVRFARTTTLGKTRQHTAAQEQAMRNVGFTVDEPTLAERAKALWQDAGKKLAQGIADQFRPIRELSGEAYALLRLSKGASGAFETLLHGGRLKLTDGVYDFDDQARGGVVKSLLVPLQGEHHDFFRWIAANRAERLAGEGRENLFSPADIAALKTLADGDLAFDYTLQHGPKKGQVTRKRAEAYADSLVTFNEFNRNVMDMAEQSGLIDPEARKLWEHEFYVPFYRVAEDFDTGVRGANIKSGVVRQKAFERLKGGKEKLNADLLDNTLLNWAHLLDASAKNRAAKATLEAAQAQGIAIEAKEDVARQIGKATGNRQGVVWFMDSGLQRFFVVERQDVLEAITSLEYAGMRNPVMNAMGAFKHWLTVGVTASPFFKVRNLIRDSLTVLATSQISPNVGKNLKEGWKDTNPQRDRYFQLLAGGGTIHFGTMLEGTEAKRVQALVESGIDQATILNTEEKVKAFYRRWVEPALTAYNELGNRGEAVNRAALYDQLRKKGMSHAEASLQARDLMDFSMQGTWTSIRFLTQVVPFFNARIQGMYKLGRAAKEDPARFAAVTGAVALVSLALLAAYGDDDDWKRREEWDRDNFWWFKLGGIAFRIPKPFEIGAMATLAERSAELLFDDEMTGDRFRKAVLKLAGDQLSMNPVPQLIKPVVDVYANWDSFTDRPIENMAMARLQPEYRFTERTSMAARGISTGLNTAAGAVGMQSVSPVQVDHLLRGYFGWLGAFIVSVGDTVFRPATGQPEKAAPDYWKSLTGGMVAELEGAPSRYVSQMYHQAAEIEQAYGTWRMLQQQGKAAEAAEFRADNLDKLAKFPAIERIKRQESELNQRIREIELSNLDAVAKRERIQQIRDQQDRLARGLR